MKDILNSQKKNYILHFINFLCLQVTSFKQNKKITSSQEINLFNLVNVAARNVVDRSLLRAISRWLHLANTSIAGRASVVITAMTYLLSKKSE